MLRLSNRKSLGPSLARDSAVELASSTGPVRCLLYFSFFWGGGIMLSNHRRSVRRRWPLAAALPSLTIVANTAP
ncbi:hypothetical protein C8J57DRAFT_1722073, partial [Mycena rebaudengoi]